MVSLRTSLVWLLAAAACSSHEPLGPDVEATEAAGLCGISGASRPMLASANDRDLRLIRADGSAHTLMTFAEGPSPGWISSQVDTRDGFVLTWAHWYTATAETQIESALFTVEGALVWHRLEAPGYNQVRLGAAGQVVFSAWDRGMMQIAPDGTVRERDDLFPISAPLADGTVAVRRMDWAWLVFGWLAPGAADFVPAMFDATTFDVGFAGDHAVYLSLDDAGGWILVDESPFGARTIPLPVAPDENPDLEDLGDRFILIRDTGTWLPLIRVDLETGDAQRLAMTFPDGQYPFNYQMFFRAHLDDTGALLFALRDTNEGGLFRSIDDGMTWTRIGASVSHVLGIGAHSRAGSYVIDATNGLYSWEEWPAEELSTADIIGDSMQIARPADGVVRVAGGNAVGWSMSASQISPNGACVAYWQTGATGSQAETVLMDIASGAVHVIDAAPSWSFAWITSATP